MGIAAADSWAVRSFGTGRVKDLDPKGNGQGKENLRRKIYEPGRNPNLFEVAQRRRPRMNLDSLTRFKNERGEKITSICTSTVY